MIEVLRYLATFCCDIAALAEFFVVLRCSEPPPPKSPLWLGTNHESLFIVEGRGGGGFLDDNTVFRGNRREISCSLQNILGNYKGFMKGSIAYYRDL